MKHRADLDANTERLRTAFDAARAWAHENHALFRIATEHDIRGSLLTNAKRLLPLRGLPIDRETAIRVMTAVDSLLAASFGSVVAALKATRSRTLATIWRLIARGELRVDLAAPITLHTARFPVKLSSADAELLSVTPAQWDEARRFLPVVREHRSGRCQHHARIGIDRGVQASSASRDRYSNFGPSRSKSLIWRTALLETYELTHRRGRCPTERTHG